MCRTPCAHRLSKSGVLRDPLPARRRLRVKARSRKNPTGKYDPNAGKHPATAQTHTFHPDLVIFETGIAPRPVAKRNGVAPDEHL
ncbi:hypothetical protein [Kitasatospora sp. GP82]|uniref:hypothetical protein n=1 Tax=Kitasatospora sp. GP82 TaxID=3035089 RepID=UPI00247541DA|nr:hypothetical protein [Kitasatospora sp. GP82]MDH6124842.1 hypothetical protein [Kitasatospora sp. GP82]